MNTRQTVGAVAVLVLLVAVGAQAKQVDMNVEMVKPFLPAGKKLTTFVKVGLTGFELGDAGRRTPVNLAIVIDKSGSMGGGKIKKAREAAKQAVDRLADTDIISVIAYDDKVSVLVPATKLSDRKNIKKRIDALRADGGTALFAGRFGVRIRTFRFSSSAPSRKKWIK
jgi:Ca-activated chloride channel family protein